MGFASKCSMFSLPESGVENLKLKISDKWLISLDRVTYILYIKWKESNKNHTFIIARQKSTMQNSGNPTLPLIGIQFNKLLWWKGDKFNVVIGETHYVNTTYSFHFIRRETKPTIYRFNSYWRSSSSGRLDQVHREWIRMTQKNMAFWLIRPRYRNSLFSLELLLLGWVEFDKMLSALMFGWSKFQRTVHSQLRRQFSSLNHKNSIKLKDKLTQIRWQNDWC